MENQKYVPFVLIGGIILYVIGKMLYQRWRENKVLAETPDLPAAPVVEEPVEVPQETMYLVLEGPEKGLLVRLDPFARVGGSGSEGTWVCAHRGDRTYVRVDGVDSQIGMVILDLFALLGPVEAKATLARRAHVLPESRLHEVEAGMGGFTAMEGWLQVPSLANYQPPSEDELPEVLSIALDLGETKVRMLLEREKLLEVASRRTHPTASPRDVKPGTPVTDPLEIMKMAQERYAENPALALALLEQHFGTGPLPAVDEPVVCGLAQIWGLTLRNLGRFDEAIARFSEGLMVARSPLAQQELTYNRGYARLASMMTSRVDNGDGTFTSSFAVDVSNLDALKACLADFEEAARLAPEDGDARSQVELTRKLLAQASGA